MVFHSFVRVVYVVNVERRLGVHGIACRLAGYTLNRCIAQRFQGAIWEGATARRRESEKETV